MFTVFSVEYRKLKGFKRIFTFLMRDRLTEEYKEYEKLLVRQMHYISYRDKINCQVVYDRAGYEAKCLVCNDDIVFPPNSGLIRFRDNAFQKKITDNFAFEVLRTMENPHKLRIAFFDIDGSQRDFVDKLCEFTDNFIIITAEKNKYFEISEKMMEEKGVSLVLTNRIDRMKDAQLVIAPSRIMRIIDLSPKSIVLTGEKPCFDISAQCYFGYKAEVPSAYAEFMPKGMDEIYFLSCLYSKGRIRSLVKTIPKVAFNESTTCTVKSLAKYLDKLSADA